MKELLIKIKALFEGSGANQAADAIEKVGKAADVAESKGKGLSGVFDDGNVKAGLFAGGMAALATGIISFVQNAVELGIAAVKALVAGFIDGIKEAAGFADKMVELGDRTGAPIDKLVILQKEFDNAGVSMDKLGPVLNKVQKDLVDAGDDSSKAAEHFKKLGLDIDSLNKLDAVGQFNAIGKAIASIKDPAQQAEMAMSLLGKNGGEMLKIFKDTNAFATAATQVGSLAENTKKAGGALASFNDNMRSMDDKKMQFFMAAAAQFATELEKAGINLAKIDLGPLGEDVGLVVRGAIEVGKAIGSWLSDFAKVLNMIGLSDTAMKNLGMTIVRSLDPTGIVSFVGYLHSAGQAAVAADNSQKDWKAEIDASTASANVLLDRMKANEQQARGAIATIKAQGTEEIDTHATTAGNKITEVGKAGQGAVKSETKTGTDQMRLTSQEILEAANKLADAFKTGMGQSISPALQALVTATRENLTNIGQGIDKVARATMESGNTITQTVTAGINTIGQSAAANDRALGSAIVSTNRALINAVNALQSQINALAARR